jgi:type IV pilus assembly protein PilM
VRIVLLDFDALPERRQEADAVVRFRLKKSLPFDVEHASLSYHVSRENGIVRIVAAVAQASVVEEYESAFRDTGYHPGVVLPSMLASIGTVEAERATLVVKLDASTTTVAILDQGQLLLFRTLENPGGGQVDGTQLAESVYPSLVFFQDTYGISVQRVLVAGVPVQQIGTALEEQTGARVEELVSTSYLGTSASDSSRNMLAGVVGALLG